MYKIKSWQDTFNNTFIDHTLGILLFSIMISIENVKIHLEDTFAIFFPSDQHFVIVAL